MPDRRWSARVIRERTRREAAAIAVGLVAAGQLLELVVVRSPSHGAEGLHLLATGLVALSCGPRAGLSTAVACAVLVHLVSGVRTGDLAVSAPCVVQVLLHVGTALLLAEVRALVQALEGDRRSARRDLAEGQAVLSVVTHDLRSPLLGVKWQSGLIERLVDHGAPPESLRDLIGVVGEGVDRALRLVADLRDAESLSRGELRVEPHAQALHETVARTLALLAGRASERGVVLEASLPASLPTVHADRVDQVLTNLLDNAIRFSPPGGRVLVSAETAGDAVRLHVVDQGPGIAAEDRPYLFERFWRGAHGAVGTGLGLFIARGLVAAQGGTLGVDSEVGAGSDFVVELPVAPRAA